MNISCFSAQVMESLICWRNRLGPEENWGPEANWFARNPENEPNLLKVSITEVGVVLLTVAAAIEIVAGLIFTALCVPIGIFDDGALLHLTLKHIDKAGQTVLWGFINIFANFMFNNLPTRLPFFNEKMWGIADLNRDDVAFLDEWRAINGPAAPAPAPVPPADPADFADLSADEAELVAVMDVPDEVEGLSSSVKRRFSIALERIVFSDVDAETIKSFMAYDAEIYSFIQTKVMFAYVLGEKKACSVDGVLFFTNETRDKIKELRSSLTASDELRARLKSVLTSFKNYQDCEKSSELYEVMNKLRIGGSKELQSKLLFSDECMAATIAELKRKYPDIKITEE